MSGTITNNPTLTWAQPANGVIEQSGAWDQGGQPTLVVPDAATIGVFATGSATPYRITVVGQVGQIQILGDSVTLTSGYLVPAGAPDPVTPGLISDLVIGQDAVVTMERSGQIAGGDAVVIGDGSPGTLILDGQLSDASGFMKSGAMTITGSGAAWRNSASVEIDRGSVSMSAAGVIATSGTMTIGAGGTLAFDDTVQIQVNTIDLAGGELALSGIVATGTLSLSAVVMLSPGANVISVAPGATLIDYRGFVAAGSVAGDLNLVGGGTFDFYQPNVFAAFDVNASTAVLLAPGAASITGSTGAVVLDNSGSLVASDGIGVFGVLASTGSDSVTMGAADTVAFGGSAGLTVQTGAGQSVIEAVAGAVTDVLVRGAATGGQAVFYNGLGASTLVGAGGSDTVFAGAGGGFFLGGTSGNNALVAGTGAATLVGGGANDVLLGSSATVGRALLIAGGGDESLVGGLGADTLVGGSGASVLFGGINRSTLYGGSGANVLVGRGQDSMYGGAGGIVMYGGTGGDVMIGGQGNATMIAGSGGSTLVGGNASNTYVGGSGADTVSVFGGGGSDVFFTGSGVTDIVEGNGSALAVMQSGVAVVFGGKGQDIYSFTNGSAGGYDFISGFKQGTDQLSFAGYGANPIASQSVSNGSLLLTLEDGTHVTLLGITSLNQ